MIADFLVDYQYLADLLSQDSDGRALTLVKMLCSLVDNDNARLIADDKFDCLLPLRKMAGVPSDGISIEERQRKRVLEWFGNIGDNLHRFRKIDGYGAGDFWSKLNPPPLFVITNEGCPGASWGDDRMRRTLEGYFRDNDKEKKRIRMGRRRSFGRNLESHEALSEAVARFCADDDNFTIIDRYALGGGKTENIESCCSNIAKWARMISNDGTKACEIAVIANGGNCNAGEISVKVQTYLTTFWRREVGNSGSEKCVVRFRLVPGDGQSLKDPRFHDRFICSRTRVLGIGKGMDVYDKSGNVTCVNLQYCGRRKGDALIDQLVKMQTLPSFEVEL